MEKNLFQRMLAQVDELSGKQREILAQILSTQSDAQHVTAVVENQLESKRECIHCHSENVKKWGVANGLQRFRCYACGRTFNALTGSALATLRRKDRWMQMAIALNQGLSVRRTAALCCVSVPTAFRWRHRFLRAATKHSPAQLEGITEVKKTWFPESFKGSRTLPRPPRKRGGRPDAKEPEVRRVPVVLARDRHGIAKDSVLPDHSTAALKLAVSASLGKNTVVCLDRRMEMIAFAKACNTPFKLMAQGKSVHADDPIFHTCTILGYHQRLREWLARFNGVATKYLPNYLAWRQIYERPHAILTPTGWIQTALDRINQHLI
jgi:transposase-like protein